MTKLDDRIDKLLEMATRTEARLDALYTTTEKLEDAVSTGFLRMNGRVVKLETWRAKAVGIATAVATATSIAIHYIIERGR